MRTIVFDTETTGLRSLDQVIEIGATEIIDRVVGETVSWRIKPTVSIDPGAEAIHGISNVDLMGERPFGPVYEDFRAFIGDATELVAHNSTFDCRMLDGDCRRSGKRPFSHDYQLIVDTLKMSRDRGVTRGNKLDTLATYYGVENLRGRYHGAGDDSLMLAHIYLKMTAGQTVMTLANDDPVAGTVFQIPTDRITRTVSIPSVAELRAHAEFCKANGIAVF